MNKKVKIKTRNFLHIGTEDKKKKAWLVESFKMHSGNRINSVYMRRNDFAYHCDWLIKKLKGEYVL